MRRFTYALALTLALAAPSAQAGWFSPIKGNTTGGIIAWTPDVEATFPQMASAHCAQYNKEAFITSVHRNYGDYVGFICAFPRDYDPRKAFWARWQPVR